MDHPDLQSNFMEDSIGLIQGLHRLEKYLNLEGFL